MNFVHLTNPYRQNILIILLLVCVPFSLGSICNYWITVNEDSSSLKQIEQMRKCALSQKAGVIIVLSLIHFEN